MIEIKANRFLCFSIQRGMCQLKEKQKMVKTFVLKLLLIDFGYAVNVVHGSTKLFMDDLLSNGLHEKVMVCLLKVD